VWPDLGDPADIDYALVWMPEPGVLANLPALKAIFNLGAGVDHLLADPSLPKVPLARTVDPDMAMRMSEYVVFHVLLHHRQHLLYAAQQRRQQWQGHPQPAASEVRVGVMGLGSLGADAARKLSLLGFATAGWSRSEKSLAGIDCFHGTDGLKPFLNRTDILVVLLPATDRTKGIIDARLLSSLAQDGVLGGPVLINAGRGALQVEADIEAALDSGTLKAASLDVFEEEPLPPSSPLWHHPNVVVTPHNAADSGALPLCRGILEQIRTFESSGILRHLVDRQRGY
jgi:glyoxylate/hydroxypyruvate reductase A